MTKPCWVVKCTTSASARSTVPSDAGRTFSGGACSSRTRRTPDRAASAARATASSGGEPTGGGASTAAASAAARTTRRGATRSSRYDPGSRGTGIARAPRAARGHRRARRRSARYRRRGQRSAARRPPRAAASRRNSSAGRLPREEGVHPARRPLTVEHALDCAACAGQPAAARPTRPNRRTRCSRALASSSSSPRYAGNALTIESSGPSTRSIAQPAPAMAATYTPSGCAPSPPARRWTGCEARKTSRSRSLSTTCSRQASSVAPGLATRAVSRSSAGRSRAWWRTWRAYTTSTVWSSSGIDSPNASTIRTRSSPSCSIAPRPMWSLGSGSSAITARGALALERVRRDPGSGADVEDGLAAERRQQPAYGVELG